MANKSEVAPTIPPTAPAAKSTKTGKPKYEKSDRPSIPAQTQRELWGRSAGRCEFHGCNEPLFIDSVSQKRSNLATIAHIVAFSPAGPRGHATRSKELEIDINNLMLTCKIHGDLIDNLNYVDQFTEEILLDYKRTHESRIRDATHAIENAKTTLLLVQGRIAGRESVINEEAVKQAIKPRWPGSDSSIIIDLNAYRISEGRAAYWDAASEQVVQETRDLLKKKLTKEEIQHVSVFALAPIPLLVLLGHELTSRLDLDLFQYHRSAASNRWCWQVGQPGSDDGLNPYLPEHIVDVEDVAIAVSMSGIVERSAISRAIGREHLIYEIRAQKPGPDFLKYRAQLSEYGTMLRSILTSIRANVTSVKRIHLFLASPASVAIDSGRSFIEKADPEVFVYEFDSPYYNHALTINSARKT